MLVPAWGIDVVNWLLGLVPGGDQLPTLPPLLAYPLTWLATTFIMGVLGFLIGLAVIAPVGKLVQAIGDSVVTRVPSGCDLRDRIAYATKGRAVRNIGEAVERVGNRAAGVTWVLPSASSTSTMGKDSGTRGHAVRLLRAFTKAATILAGFLDLVRLLITAAIRPSWTNLIRWSIVVMYLNQAWFLGTSWQQIEGEVASWNIPIGIVSAVGAVLAFAFVMAGSVWRRGHKWSSKFHEANASRRMEFLNQSLPPLRQIATSLYKLGHTCETGALSRVRRVVEDATGGAFTVESDWKTTAIRSGKWRVQPRWPRLGDEPASTRLSELGAAVTQLSEAYRKLDQENLSRFLISSVPQRLRFEIYTLEISLQRWERIGRDLELSSVEKHIAENHLLESVRNVSRNDELATTSATRTSQRWTPSKDEVPYLVEDAVEREYKHIDGLLSETAEAIAAIQSVTQYAHRETRSSWLQRLLGNR